jgi:hypothetical protein
MKAFLHLYEAYALVWNKFREDQFIQTKVMEVLTTLVGVIWVVMLLPSMIMQFYFEDDTKCDDCFDDNVCTVHPNVNIYEERALKMLFWFGLWFIPVGLIAFLAAFVLTFLLVLQGSVIFIISFVVGFAIGLVTAIVSTLISFF